MSAPLYFLPNVYRQHLVQGSRLVAAVIEARGLTSIFGDVVDVQRELSISEITASGPGGASGTLLVPLAAGREPPVRLGFKPDFQTWHDEADFWLGFDREAPPGPEDLAREKQVGGHWLEIAGQRWLVPILRRPDETSEFPTAYRRERDGTLREQVRGEYRALWEAAAELVEWFASGTINDLVHVKAQFPRLIDWCVRVLAVNYRFDWTLQNHLSILGSHDWPLVLALAIDWGTAQALHAPQKKTDPPRETNTAPVSDDNARNISPGSAAVAAEDIDPAAG